MKRAISLILSFCIFFSVCFCLVSCDREYNAEEVKTAAEDLIEKSLLLNEIYWGAGIPYMSGNTSVYCEANIIALSELGFYTIEELKDKTKEVFTVKYSSYIFSTAFSSINDGEEIQFYARYYQKYSDEFQTEPENIMVYSGFENMLPDKIEYLYDTLVVTHSKGDTVYVKVDVRVTRDEESVQIREKIIGLIEEDKGWRIDTATYLRYNDRQEEYEDLLEKKE